MYSPSRHGPVAAAGGATVDGASPADVGRTDVVLGVVVARLVVRVVGTNGVVGRVGGGETVALAVVTVPVWQSTLSGQSHSFSASFQYRPGEHWLFFNTPSTHRAKDAQSSGTG